MDAIMPAACVGGGGPTSLPACLHEWRQANQPARQGQQQCCSGHRCSAAEAAAVPAPATGEDSSDSIVQQRLDRPMQTQRGKKDISSSQIPKKKKKKRKNTSNGSIINCLMFGVSFLRSRCLEWQNCEAQRLESQICNFLLLYSLCPCFIVCIKMTSLLLN